MPYLKNARTNSSLDECCRNSQPCCWDDRSGLVKGGRSKSMALGEEKPDLFGFIKDVGASAAGMVAGAVDATGSVVSTAVGTATPKPVVASNEGMSLATKLAIGGGAVLIAALIFRRK